jgi:glutamate formiminotransferase/glutamate formiminotransferase/formiminotetrahydrofolate cyclodeaminase
VSLLAVPNFSEGRDTSVIAAIRAALDADRGLLDRHSDPEHNRTVYTLAGEGRALEERLAAGASVAIEQIDMRRQRGLHPCIGALDVCPLVWLDIEGREPARARARSVGERIGSLGVPVFLYGELASSEERQERAFFREGGLTALRQRMKAGELAPDMGPEIPHLSAGATLVTARPPLAAFNIELDTGDAVVAQRIAAAVREAGGGSAGVRAIGLPLEGGRSQVSTNVHDPIAVPLRMIVARVTELAAEQGARPVEAEIVGLVPAAALQGFPQELPIRDFDPERHVIERRLSPTR